MARHTSLAEYYRAHGRAFRRALETGCTPAEAAAEIEREDAIARCREAEARLQAKIAAPIEPRRRELPADAPWMLRD
jgi:hypothetical protein